MRLRRASLGWSLSFAAICLLGGCFARPPAGDSWRAVTGPTPSTERPSGPVVAAWVEEKHVYGEPDESRLLVLDARRRVYALPAELEDDCFRFGPFGVVLSPDGTKVAVTMDSGCTEPRTGRVQVLDVVSGDLFSTIPAESSLTNIAWAPDSRRLVVTSLRAPASVVDVNGAVLAKLPVGYEPEWAPSDSIALVMPGFGHDYGLMQPDGGDLVRLAQVKVGRWLDEDSFLGERVDYGPGNGRDTLLFGQDGGVEEWRCRSDSGPVSADGETMVRVAYNEVAPKRSYAFIEVCDISTGRRARLSPDFTPAALSGLNLTWLPDGHIGVVAAGSLQAVDPETGDHIVLAKPAKGFIYGHLSTTLGNGDL